ncbi:type I methionyl aminopeptidase [Candidatus Daviesbacteria bacterium RIFCSPHIGHO2_01_FULL_44_29]|uniref:Methionine aminopeptidase n=1 Tax=Candidatus Daviesbacteria bacterium RIFCSPHIGHO2_02_FULL_43_12 TaxID=1797776 RepID=A0A1F5KGD1_9BACT|nr:MAG: type I methionyl aminopeptidase [Candidatus Daviesbacteria bacterium RIFCSPHIGHO2_01_FULL_44_29]OGE39938.1 MAG: type I methionyl aminopeptidase [Candidatus Daviesbacteria bacterium RIFCSPHIGHO2_02_FULL_43_12]OGE40504.1 MAG: type I methionyl aminopeptidase [Candidatus Daviesbacteria bacterium RIFCSPHIGHO2_12_FULL_47_45]OGE70381.1 MAG: type I methionyl aminopeptidase [Candidatus Daviesbacteria bacterium RIFCSPLOWO2_01_FULL_43_15]
MAAVNIRTEEELQLMRKSGWISAQALKKTIEAVAVGVSLWDLERIAEAEILRHGAEAAFKKVPGYSYTCCLTVNDELVHGIPRNIILKQGDKVSIDLGACFKGWNTDTAWSVIVGGAKSSFLEVGERALWAAVDLAIEGGRIGDIGGVIQEIVENQSGYSVSRTLIGHGIGRKLHEAPEVPGFGTQGTGLVLKAGMTIAIEVIFAEKSAEVVLAPDKWTLVTADGSMGGLFEMTLIVGKESAEVLTDWRTV